MEALVARARGWRCRAKVGIVRAWHGYGCWDSFFFLFNKTRLSHAQNNTKCFGLLRSFLLLHILILVGGSVIYSSCLTAYYKYVVHLHISRFIAYQFAFLFSRLVLGYLVEYYYFLLANSETITFCFLDETNGFTPARYFITHSIAAWALWVVQPRFIGKW